jgi:adenosine deaminase
VVGFDLAGLEESHPAKHHREAFYRILNNNINTTAHAGEAYGPESIHQAIHYCGAHRIGHGTRLIEDGDLMNYVNDHRIPLEICLTSNVQTKATPSFEKHPLKFYYDFGLRTTINTDNRLISNTTVTKELGLATKYANLNINDLKTIIVAGFKSAFLPMRERAIMLNLVNNELEKY